MNEHGDDLGWIRELPTGGFNLADHLSDEDIDQLRHALYEVLNGHEEQTGYQPCCECEWCGKEKWHDGPKGLPFDRDNLKFAVPIWNQDDDEWQLWCGECAAEEDRIDLIDPTNKPTGA